MPVWGAAAVQIAGVNLIAHSIAPLLLFGILIAFCGLRETVDFHGAAAAEAIGSNNGNATSAPNAGSMLSMGATSGGARYSDYAL